MIDIFLPVLQVQGQGVSNKVNGTGLQAEVLVHVLHGGDGNIDAAVGGGVILLVVLDELEELLGATLLKETHEGRADSLHLAGRDLGDLSIAVDEGAGDLLELQVAGDVGVDQDLDELTVGHHELGDQVDVVVTVAAQLSWGSLATAELSEELWCIGYKRR